jgi:putative transposase
MSGFNLRQAQAAYHVPSRAITREFAAGVVADYGPKYDSAVARFMDDFEPCIAHLRFPVTHRRAIRTTNLLKRLFVAERRPNGFGERAVLKLMFGALIGAA